MAPMSAFDQTLNEAPDVNRLVSGSWDRFTRRIFNSAFTRCDWAGRHVSFVEANLPVQVVGQGVVGVVTQ